MKALLALGSNVGDRADNFIRCFALLRESGLQILAKSRFHETLAFGDPGGPDFLNAVIEVDGLDDPWVYLALAKQVERELGRDLAAPRNSPRKMDIDVIACRGVTMISTSLTLPHPRLSGRSFVLSPMSEIPGVQDYFLGEWSTELRQV